VATVTSYGTKGTEIGQSVVARRFVGDATRPAALFCHGRGTTPLEVTDPTWGQGVSKALAEAGYPVLAGTLSGTAPWGNDASQAKLADARTYAQGTLGAASGKVGLVGLSMGALTALNWTRANPTLVACIALLIPVTDLDYLHANNVNGWAAEIEAAYTNLAGYNAAVATHDPNQNTSSHASGPPIKVWYSSTDTSAVTARQQAFITAVGCPSVSLGAVGHALTGLDAQQVVAFFQANL
jgi:alpha-beta hydrolase superfamily lysophospholipase